jgi:hypothetical protein
MTDELKLREAVQVAWSLYLATHGDVEAADQRRCSLSRHLQGLLHAGQNDTEELACSGLAYLDRIPADPW